MTEQPQPPSGPEGVPPPQPPQQPPQYGQPPPQYQQPVQYAQPWRPPGEKNNALAIVLAFLLPGLGHLYVGGKETERGIFLLVGAVVSIFLVLILIGIFAYIALWIFGMIDANRAANEYNQQLYAYYQYQQAQQQPPYGPS